MTIPVLVLVPDGEQLPKGWEVLPREQSTPRWWRSTATGGGEAAAAGTTAAVNGIQESPAAPSPGAESSAAPQVGADTGTGAAPERAPEQGDRPVTSLGKAVVDSEVYEAQKEYVRKAPEAKVVAAVIDALAAAGGTMSPAALAAAISATGRVRRNVEGFVATVQRLLNVEGYPVLGFIDGGHAVKLDLPLLREQFLVTAKEHE